MKKISLNLVVGDIRTYKADCLVLKYAQRSLGVDRIVSDIFLSKKFYKNFDLFPSVGYVVEVQNNTSITGLFYSEVAFIGTVPT